MRYRPHEYQKYATEYIETHPVAAVLLSMGLGKTSITPVSYTHRDVYKRQGRESLRRHTASALITGAPCSLSPFLPAGGLPM